MEIGTSALVRYEYLKQRKDEYVRVLMFKLGAEQFGRFWTPVVACALFIIVNKMEDDEYDTPPELTHGLFASADLYDAEVRVLAVLYGASIRPSEDRGVSGK
jgi:hypothetical protein